MVKEQVFYQKLQVQSDANFIWWEKLTGYDYILRIMANNLRLVLASNLKSLITYVQQISSLKLLSFCINIIMIYSSMGHQSYQSINQQIKNKYFIAKKKCS